MESNQSGVCIGKDVEPNGQSTHHQSAVENVKPPRPLEPPPKPPQSENFAIVDDIAIDDQLNDHSSKDPIDTLEASCQRVGPHDEGMGSHDSSHRVHAHAWPPLPPTPPPKRTNQEQREIKSESETSKSFQGNASGSDKKSSFQGDAATDDSRPKGIAPALTDVYDSLLAAAKDGNVSGSVGRSLARLAITKHGSGLANFIERAVDLLSQHANAVTDDAIRSGLPHRVNLHRIVASVLSKAKEEGVAALPEELATRLGNMGVADLTAIKIAALAVTFGVEAGSEWDLQRAASRMLVSLASLHLSSVLTQLLPKLETCSMFQQQQAQRRGGGKAGFQAQELCLMLVLFTLQDMATRYPDDLAGAFRRVLARLLPVMGLAISAQTKEAWAACFAACCLALRHAHRERAAAAAGGGGGQQGVVEWWGGVQEDRGLGLAVQAAHEVVGSSWAAGRDPRLQAAGAQAPRRLSVSRRAAYPCRA